jgi:peroxiredoxin
VAGLDFSTGPTVLWFYKVTCPVCQLAAPVAGSMAGVHPGRFTGIGQDPPERLAGFDQEYGLGFESRPDLPPYELSNAYGVRVVPTMFVVDPAGTIVDAVESWDLPGYERVAARLGDLLGAKAADLTAVTAGLPAFRPG